MEFSRVAHRCKIDGKHGETRSVELEPDEEFQSKYGKTRHGQDQVHHAHLNANIARTLHHYRPFSPSFVTMSSSKPIGVRRMNRRNLAQRLEDHCYEALAFSRHNIDLVFDEEKTATRKTHQGARKCRY